MGCGTSHTTQIPTEVVQSDGSKLNVTVDNFPIQDHIQNTPHYVTLPHNTTTVVWTPGANNKIHLVSLVVSATAAGYAILYDRTPPATDVAFMRLEFNLRQAVPFGLNTDLDFDYDHVLVAIFVGDAAAPNAYITAIGHEHSVSAFPP